MPRVSLTVTTPADDEGTADFELRSPLRSPLLSSQGSARRLSITITRRRRSWQPPVKHTLHIDLALVCFLLLVFAGAATGFGVVGARPAGHSFSAATRGGFARGAATVLAPPSGWGRGGGGEATEMPTPMSQLAMRAADGRVAALRSRAGLVRFCLAAEHQMGDSVAPRWLAARASEAACSILFPVAFAHIARGHELRRDGAERALQDAAVELTSALTNELPEGSRFSVDARYKSAVSIFEKVILRGKRADDVLALRIVLDGDTTAEEAMGGCDARCYHAAELVSELWPSPLTAPKDYIAQPKRNGYQSLHHLVKMRDGTPLEIQIRTRCMHQVAEHGSAAHGAYKLAAASAVAGGRAPTSWVT